jgi:hypothetical protein
MRILASFAALAAVSVLAACQQPAPTPKVDAPAPKAAPAIPMPPDVLAQTYTSCTWGEVKGGGAALWAFECAGDKIVYDAALPGFVRELQGEGASKTPIKATVVQLFTKAGDAPIDAVLPALRVASKGGQACVLEQIKDAPAGEFQLMPEGPARKAYDEAISGRSNANSNLLPCGPLGPSEAGMRVIRGVPGAPTLVAVIHMPSDIGTFDPATLKAAP